MADDGDAATAVPAGVASMLKSSDPTPREEFSQGACELPRTSQGDDAKITKKNKDACCVGLEHKYDLNSFQVTDSNQENEEDTPPVAKSTQYALIYTSYKNRLTNLDLKPCDTLNGLLVSELINRSQYQN